VQREKSSTHQRQPERQWTTESQLEAVNKAAFDIAALHSGELQSRKPALVYTLATYLLVASTADVYK
jgi:hypothetical protein